MQPRARAVVIAVFIVVAALLAIRFATQGPDPAGEEEGPATTRFTAPRFVGYHQGARQWVLEADEIEERQGEKGERIVHLVRVHRGILYRDGEEAMRFEADRGEWRERSNDLTLEGNVVFTNQDGMRFTTDIVHWNAKTEELSSPTRVSITYKEQSFVADTLHADVKADRYRFMGNVEWTNDAGAFIRAQTAVYSDEKGTLEFEELDGPAQIVLDP